MRAAERGEEEKKQGFRADFGFGESETLVGVEFGGVERESLKKETKQKHRNYNLQPRDLFFSHPQSASLEEKTFLHFLRWCINKLFIAI